MDVYFVNQKTKTSDSEIYAIATTVKHDRDEAYALYHQILASVYITPNMEHFIVDIENKHGNKEIMETRVPAEPEPEPNEE